jgi:hypothetical protein
VAALGACICSDAASIVANPSEVTVAAGDLRLCVDCRRDVWHGSDMAGAGRLRAQWNEALLQLVVAPAYLELLVAAAKLLGHSPQFNRCAHVSCGWTTGPHLCIHTCTHSPAVVPLQHEVYSACSTYNGMFLLVHAHVPV